MNTVLTNMCQMTLITGPGLGHKIPVADLDPAHREGLTFEELSLERAKAKVKEVENHPHHLPLPQACPKDKTVTYVTNKVILLLNAARITEIGQIPGIIGLAQAVPPTLGKHITLEVKENLDPHTEEGA